ncbi:MAG TPA: polyprenyl synthetase family protein [Spirochaetia bacterium]|nr:polyprenyl synthetase family protein [Spirochaetia bacterium]
MQSAYFDPIRGRLVSALQSFLRVKSAELARVNPMGAEAVRRLLEFSVRGKMMRGCLVHLGWELARTKAAGSPGDGAPGDAAVTTVGAAMELFQSGLLVHDDIMDRDAVRRGQPSIFRQYEEEAERDGSADPAHVGQALGICAGDVAYFMAFELLAGGDVPAAVAARVLGLCARELSAVGVAQMQDVAWGASARPVGSQQILAMYTWKTGRYSFSLPLLAGAALAQGPADRHAVQLAAGLEACGEGLGVLFQLRDDELGIFGTEEQTGKPLASDLREGKKTLLVSLLMEESTPAERRRLQDILGNPGCTVEDLDFVRGLAGSAPVRRGMRALVDDLTARAEQAIRDLPTGSEEARAALRSLLDFTTARSQ